MRLLQKRAAFLFLCLGVTTIDIHVVAVGSDYEGVWKVVIDFMDCPVFSAICRFGFGDSSGGC
jgi:hypothetical protein